MNQQNSMSGEVAAEWERLKEQWRRGRASAPTRRDLALARQQEQLAEDGTRQKATPRWQ